MADAFPHLMTLFSAALERPPGPERATYLDAACGGDAALRAEVEALLAVSARAGGFLEGAAKDAERTIDSPPPAGAASTMVGPYKLVEPIGEGGMGSVWMAQQTEPVKRLVAVKLIKPGMDSKQVLARFEAERQALALMDHPNIARVLDAGTIAAGRPYFVMDLVKGVPITKYCDDHHLTPRQRLELFISVCQAVQHAHQKGIIHRDLKPSNVLVALYDGKPVPKVIDFGVAKAAGQSLTDKTLVTGFGNIVGTLEYMSPEQAEVNQLDIDTRSDIYSLGVLLYELLAGSTPFSKKDLEKAGMLEMLRVIREDEPSKPSTKLSSSDALPTLSANRGTEPAKLTKLVRGELDWIVMKALEKDRNRRFETANGFAMDVQRYLADEAVLACPPSAAYRLRKFARRHRGPVVAAGLLLLALIGGTTGTTLALLQAERNAKQVRDERDAKDGALKAEQQARAGETKARQQAFAALRSMTDNVVERKFAQGTDLTDEDRAFLRGVIAQYDAFAAINGDDVDSQALRAEGRWRIGLMRTRLGEVQEAEKAYDEAVSISERLAAELPTRIEFRMWLAFSLQNRSELLFARGRPQEGEKDFDQAFSISKQLAADFPQNPGFRKLLAKSHRFRGDLLVATRRLNEAEKEYDLAVSIQERLAADFPKDPVFRLDLAKSHTARANLLKYTGRLKEAEKEHDMAVSIQERLAADFPKQPELRKDLAEILNDRGTFLMQTGRLKEAEKDFDQALSICGQLVADFPLRPRFQYLLATGHLNRGGLLSQTPSRLREAEQDLDQAISITKQCGANSPSSRGSGTLAAGYTNRGIVLEQTGRLKEAEKDLDQALSMRRQLAAGTPNQPDLQNDVAGSCVNLANFYSQQRNWAAAKRLLLEGRAHHLVALKANPRHPTYRQFYRNHLNTLAQVHAELLEREEAVRTAETRRELGWNPPADAYDAAGFLIRCIPIVAQHDKLDDKQRQEAVRFYGDAAMKLLREAVSNGYKDVVHMKKDPALAPLRQRQDFLKLVAALEGKGK